MPERFRGRLLLRRWLLPHSPARPFREQAPGDAAALAAPSRPGNATLGEKLTGCAVLQLVLCEVDTAQMLEGRIGDGRADARLGKRIDRRLGLAGLAWTG